MRDSMILGFVLALAFGCDGSGAAPADAGSDADPMSDAALADGAVPDGGFADCWQADSIPDVSGWGNAGAAFPEPAVAGACAGGDFVITSNGIPTFEYVAITPNGLEEKSYRWTIPKEPARAASTTDVPLLGPAAVTVTGLPIFGPTENPMDGYRDPILDDVLSNLLDECNGHTAPMGTYHFHGRPECIVADLGGESYGLVVGWAFDGYPILAPLICDDASCSSTTRVRSSWELTLSEYTTSTRGPAWDIHEYVAGSGDLDECNGLAIDDASLPYDYAYFATDTFPYFMGCYRGTPDAANVVGG